MSVCLCWGCIANTCSHLKDACTYTVLRDLLEGLYLHIQDKIVTVRLFLSSLTECNGSADPDKPMTKGTHPKPESITQGVLMLVTYV